MAAGQLAGGLAWLTISGEDAPDLVATAPVPPRFVLRAKIEAVLGVIALVFAPLVVVLAFASPWHALVTAAGIVVAAARGDRDPALVPHPGQAQPVPPPAGVVARRDFRRGVLLDRLGRDRRRRRGQSLARHPAPPPSRSPSSAARVSEPKAQGA